MPRHEARHLPAQRFATEEAYRDHLFKLRWPEGSWCPHCGCDSAYLFEERILYQCTSCNPSFLDCGMVMHKTRTPLVKWFWAIYFVSTDKRGLSVLALSRKVGIGLKCAWAMLHKIRKATEARNAAYQLAGLIQVNDAFSKDASVKTAINEAEAPKKFQPLL